ncbi:MAG: 5-amino-6-(D-ribitylamino)uracil--L-tyrosine 4-hydroxyphenyl transferase CofH [Candidatus Heimdallarchaeota archaeon]|nr:5-amino-6-(D-ribitylamino)uracil--L-tyrosine 4-hydroxyphenyl transferase CofH [Candidatus Heimdallarchaeota archaeon]MDH5645056.1 5-amino-6-(D-ribitylamino)uracil--L-tyrosine 4-hydroxyphenyl transferase CofH [Candidatus Heimdallarchaeota archaeon]
MEYYRDDHQNLLIRLLKSRGSDLLMQMYDADKIRRNQVGDNVTFIRNQNINFSNICYTGCKFCSFAAHEGSSHAYRLNQLELEEQTAEANNNNVTEICSTAGLDPKSNLETYINVLQTFKKFAPSVHVHAFSPYEIYYLAEKEDQDFEYILKTLKNNGLMTLCGTAAEILDPEVRDILCPGKLTSDLWIEIIKIAHGLGINSTATMMYGHIDQVHNLAKHLQIIRGIQEETKGFTEFIPLPFIHNNTYIYKTGLARAGSTGMEDMAVYSTSRLYLGEFIPNLQSSWVKTGMKFASLALSAGVNDLGGTLFEEKITRFAGGNHGTYMAESEFIRFIHDANRTAIRRDTLYNPIEVFPVDDYKVWIDL